MIVTGVLVCSRPCVHTGQAVSDCEPDSRLYRVRASSCSPGQNDSGLLRVRLCYHGYYPDVVVNDFE